MNEPVAEPAQPVDRANTATVVARTSEAPASPPPPAPPKLAAVASQHLPTRHGALVALDDRPPSPDPGDGYGFTGPNGAGKSTTMKSAAGVLEPPHGPARVRGRPVAGNGDFVRRNVG